MFWKGVLVAAVKEHRAIDPTVLPSSFAVQKNHSVLFSITIQSAIFFHPSCNKAIRHGSMHI